MSATLWIDTEQEKAIELGGTIQLYRAFSDIAKTVGDHSAYYSDLFGVPTQVETQEDADPDWLKTVQTQAAEVLRKYGQKLEGYTQGLLRLLSKGGQEFPRAPQVKKLFSYYTKGKGELCKPGEASTQTGCTPAGGAAKPGAQAKPQPAAEQGIAEFEGKRPADKIFHPKAVQWLLEHDLIGNPGHSLSAEKANALLKEIQKVMATGLKPEAQEEPQQPEAKIEQAEKLSWGADKGEDKDDVLMALDGLGIEPQAAMQDQSLQQELIETLADLAADKGPINKNYLYGLLHTLSKEERVINLDDYKVEVLRPRNYAAPEESWPKDLTPQEMAAGNIYSQHEHYGPINKGLREQGEPLKKYGPVHEALQEAFKKVKSFAEPVKTRRGIDCPAEELPKLLGVLAESLESGMPLRVGGYLSTSVSGVHSPGEPNVRMWINAVHGLDLKPISDHPQEDELLLNHNSQFVVKSIKQDRQGSWIVKMDQLRPEEMSDDPFVQEGMKGQMFYLTKGRKKGTCEQGQRADLTGCTPAEETPGSPVQKQEESPVSLPKDWTGRSYLDEEIQDKLVQEANQIIDDLGARRHAPFGYCAAATYLLWEKLGRPADVVPYSFYVGEEEHVALYNKVRGWVIDPTGAQYSFPIFTMHAKENGYKKPERLSKADLEYCKQEGEEIKKRKLPKPPEVER